jgi:hypothetical protein
MLIKFVKKMEKMKIGHHVGMDLNNLTEDFFNET